MTDEVLIAGFDEIPPDTTDRNLSNQTLPRIPNVYKRWQPTEFDVGLPPELQDNPDAMVKVIFRSGNQPNHAIKAGDYFWGNTNTSSDIVAYRVIKLEKNEGWIDWGRSFDRGRPLVLDSQTGVPTGLDRQARVQVMLRNDETPQRERVRLAHEWFWEVDQSIQDIMRYRVVSSRLM